MQLANRTLDAIDAAIDKDGGALFRNNLRKVLPHISDIYRSKDGKRFHLGASVIGKDCRRAVWYGFRWYAEKRFPARLLRLFNRGHIEEARVIALLLTIGITIKQQDASGKQFAFKDGHLGGSGDGFLLGVPDVPEGMVCNLEVKTYNDRRYKELIKNGVQMYDPSHYTQMQIYNEKFKVPYSLYVAVNKNDDSIYMEVVRYSRSSALMFIERGKNIAMSKDPPPRLKNASIGWYECKWCDYKAYCLKGQDADERTCRSCKNAEPLEEGTWRCGYHKTELDRTAQVEGCDNWEGIAE